MEIETIHTDEAPPAIGPYSQGVKARGFVYTSGQIALDPNGNFVDGSFADQANRVFLNLEAILRAGGSSFSRVLKATVYLTNLAGNFDELNKIYAGYFGDHKPARTTVQVSALPKGSALEIDLIALAG